MNPVIGKKYLRRKLGASNKDFYTFQITSVDSTMVYFIVLQQPKGTYSLVYGEENSFSLSHWWNNQVEMGNIIPLTYYLINEQFNAFLKL